MNIPSEYLAKAMIEERHRETTRLVKAQQAMRVAKIKRQAESKTDHPVKHFWQLLKEVAKHLLFVPHPPGEMVHSEENLYHAEMLGISSKELGLLRERRRLYERIARGNALAEAEYVAQKIREAR